MGWHQHLVGRLDREVGKPEGVKLREFKKRKGSIQISFLSIIRTSNWPYLRPSHRVLSIPHQNHLCLSVDTALVQLSSSPAWAATTPPDNPQSSAPLLPPVHSSPSSQCSFQNKDLILRLPCSKLYNGSPLPEDEGQILVAQCPQLSIHALPSLASVPLPTLFPIFAIIFTHHASNCHFL